METDVAVIGTKYNPLVKTIQNPIQICILFDASITLTGNINALSIPGQDHVVLLTRLATLADIDVAMLKLLLYNTWPEQLSLYKNNPPYDASNRFCKLLLTRKKAESFAPNLFIFMQWCLDTAVLHPDQV